MRKQFVATLSQKSRLQQTNLKAQVRELNSFLRTCIVVGSNSQEEFVSGAAVSVENTRNGTIDVLKFVAAIGIMYFHLGLAFGEIGLSALPFFVIVLIYFACRSQTSISLAVKRLLWPWLIWCGIYAAARILDAKTHGLGIFDKFEPWMILTGPSLHLWFMPFAAVIMPIARFISSNINLWSHRRAFFAAYILVSISASEISSIELAQPLAQWVSVLPSVLFGLCAATLAATKEGRTELVAAGAISMVCAFLVGAGPSAQQNFLGQLCFLAASFWTIRENALTRILGRLSLTVYLAHPLVATIVARLIADRGSMQFFAVLLLSLLLAACLEERWSKTFWSRIWRKPSAATKSVESLGTRSA